MKKYLIFACKILIFISASLVTAELLLQVSEYTNLGQEDRQKHNYFRKVSVRVDNEWLDTTTGKNRFLPPFLVFSNKDPDDAERLRMVFEETKLPPSQSWTSYDFLQDKNRAEITSYSIRSNSLGFRGKEYPKEKARNTYRIIVLGSYDTFGHGVGDDETYAAYLEDELNKGSGEIHFEVWNGGRHAGTAIVGLARMTYEIFDYDPDLLILDYGTEDTSVFGDNFFPLAMRFPDTRISLIFRDTLRLVAPVVRKSILWSKLSVKYLNNKQAPKRVAQFQKLMRMMLLLARQNNTPVILVRQLNALPERAFRELLAADVFLFTTQYAFSKNPPTYPPPDEWKTGYWSKTWLGEIDEPGWLQNSTRKGTRFEFYPYRLDLLRLNALGQRTIGVELAQVIINDVLKTTKIK